MKRTLLLAAMLLLAATAFPQGYYTRHCADKALQKKAMKWMKNGEWRHGFTLASPDKSVNAVDFYEQYHKNPRQWQALFAWLAKADLLNLPKGKHKIEGSDLVVSIEDTQNADLAKRKSESHHHHIDFQYVVRGVERFGLIDHYTSKPNSKYKPDVVHYDYMAENAHFIDSSPDKFFIFFPSDWHIAKVKTSLPDQQIRVVVVKVDYVE